MAVSFKPNNIRRFLTKNIVDIAQSVDGIHFPGTHIDPAITTAREVGKGNIIRIVVTTAGYIAFGASSVAAPTGAVSEISVYLPVGTHYVFATDDYIRSSAALVTPSVEVIAV